MTDPRIKAAEELNRCVCEWDREARRERFFVACVLIVTVGILLCGITVSIWVKLTK